MHKYFNICFLLFKCHFVNAYFAIIIIIYIIYTSLLLHQYTSQYIYIYIHTHTYIYIYIYIYIIYTSLFLHLPIIIYNKLVLASLIYTAIQFILLCLLPPIFCIYHLLTFNMFSYFFF